MASKILRNTSVRIGEHWVAKVKLQSVPANTRRPDGFKLNCVLIDTRIPKPVIILDNHHPFGYHLHPDASDHENREELVVGHPKDAIKIFFEKVREILDEER